MKLMQRIGQKMEFRAEGAVQGSEVNDDTKRVHESRA